MAFDSSLPHQLPWNYPWIKDEIERRDEYIAQLEAELAHQKPQDGAHGAIEGESVKVPAEDETEAHSEPDSRERILADLEKLTQKWHDYDGNFMRVYNSVAYAQVKELLDRQDAITANELTSESDVPKQTESSEIDTSKDDMRDFNDSREKLEAEIEGYLMDNLCLDSFPCDLVSGWLDRQSAITKRNFRELEGDLTADNLWMHERIGDLQDRIAELEEENDALREWKVCYERMRDERDELVKQRNRAESDAKTQRNNYEQVSSARLHWQKKAQKAEAERDKLKAEHERIVQEMVDANTRQCERTNELTADNDYLQKRMLGLEDEIISLESERDEWKAKAEENSNGWAKANAALDKLMCAYEIRRLS